MVKNKVDILAEKPRSPLKSILYVEKLCEARGVSRSAKIIKLKIRARKKVEQNTAEKALPRPEEI